MNPVPSKVEDYFKRRGSKRHFIWPFAIHAPNKGWIQVGWIRPERQRKHGPTMEGLSWPVTTTMVQYTDGVIYADFSRGELVESEVAA